MFCSVCGNKIENNSSFCSNCGTKVEEKTVEEKIVEDQIIQESINEDTKNNNRVANILCTTSLILFFGMPIINVISYFLNANSIIYGNSFTTSASSITQSIIGIITSFSVLIAYVLMIIARVKYPKSTYAKVVMWIYIAHFIISLITLVVIIVACAGIIYSCAQAGIIW